MEQEVISLPTARTITSLFSSENGWAVALSHLLNQIDDLFNWCWLRIRVVDLERSEN